MLSTGAEVAKEFEISLVMMSPICRLSKRNSLRIEKKVGVSLQRMDTSPLATTEGWSSLGYIDTFRMLDYQLLANKKFSPTTAFFFYPCPETNSFEF